MFLVPCVVKERTSALIRHNLAFVHVCMPSVKSQCYKLCLRDVLALSQIRNVAIFPAVNHLSKKKVYIVLIDFQ